jgi:hypothetical protein
VSCVLVCVVPTCARRKHKAAGEIPAALGPFSEVVCCLSGCIAS